MSGITLEIQTDSGSKLSATFLPEEGMNLCSFKRDNLEVIDQSTRPLFDERRAGLGAIIGPHFHRRLPQTLSPIPNEEQYPHIARVRAKGVSDPFSHGIGRYAPWKYERSDQRITATLSGKDEWNGTPIAKLQGQQFIMKFTAELKKSGLHIQFSVVSDLDSVVGLHYYYALPQSGGSVRADVQPQHRDQNGWSPLPATWALDDQHRVHIPLNKEALDVGFAPYKDPCATQITLDTDTYRLETRYQSSSQQNSWQLYRPEGASFVCIEPLSALNPRRPILSVSSLSVQLSLHAK